MAAYGCPSGDLKNGMRTVSLLALDGQVDSYAASQLAGETILLPFLSSAL